MSARNSIGALILLPNGTNQSFNSDDYKDKLEHYIKENSYAQTLHHEFYKKNPNFNNSDLNSIGFKSHPNFNKKDIEERTEVVKRLCENIWNIDYFNTKQ